MTGASLGMYAVWIQQDYHVFVSMMGFKGKEVDGDSGRDELLLPRTIAMSATRANRDSFSNTRLNKLENCTELPRLPERTQHQYSIGEEVLRKYKNYCKH